MYQLATKLGRADLLQEETTMNNISFLPCHVGVVRAALVDLSKQESDWGIQVLEGEDGVKTVQFGNALKISVPHQHWDTFQEMFTGAIDNDAYLNLATILNEQQDEVLRDLRKQLKPELMRLYTTWIFDEVERNINRWRARFGVYTFEPQDVVVAYDDKKRQLQHTYNRLLSVYGQDRGNLEMLVEALRNKEPLNSFHVFRDKDFLFGTRIKSKFRGIIMMFEATVDQTYTRSETVYVDSEEVLEEIVTTMRNVKVVGNVIYPASEGFENTFFRQLKIAVDDVIQ
jgi:hypothetical protein